MIRQFCLITLTTALSSVVLVSSLSAQEVDKRAQTVEKAVPTAAKSMCEVSGTVKDTAGTPIGGGIVKVFDQDSLNHGAAGIRGDAAQRGYFQLPAIPCGDKYTLQVESADHEPLVYKDLSIHESKTTFDLVLYPWIWYLDQKVFTAILVFLYLCTIFFFRWHNIAVFDQKLLQAEAAATKTRLKIESATGNEAEDKAKELRAMLDEATKPFIKFSFLSWMFWTRGDEISSWTQLREVQRQMVSLWPDTSVERLRARIETVEQDLREANKPSTLIMADLLKNSLTKAPDVERWKQLLGEALGLLYSIREEDFQRLTTWQSKSTWLALIGCILIQASVSAKGGAVLILMGAAGGLMSRLMRALRANNEPSDYGASWTTLFLSPLLGALSAWYGILLVTGFTSLKILNPDIALKISFDEQMSLATLALAFLLGFSERLFDSIVTVAEQRVLGQDQAGSKTTARQEPGGGDGTTTSIKAVRPANPEPGDPVVIFGSMLDRANVEGIKLMSRDNQKDFTPTIDSQDASSIAFKIPNGATDGEYTLTLVAKNSANVSTTLQVGMPKKAPTTIAKPESDVFKPKAKVIFTGKSLDQDSVARAEVLDEHGTAVPGPQLEIQYSSEAISFTAPEEAKAYTLVVTPKTGTLVEQKFKVEQ